jgi:integrase
MEREIEKVPSYVPPEDFALIYQATEKGTRWPDRQPYSPGEWWRGLLMFIYMTGWRIGQTLAVRRDDVNLETGEILSRGIHNKGKRDVLVPLHPIVVDHLKKLASFDPRMFPWNHGRRSIFTEFEALQRAAGVKPERKQHYGYHDLRRAFATMNADRMTPDALQVMMQHKDYGTTQRCINLARQLKPAAHNLFVPDVGPVPQAQG